MKDRIYLILFCVVCLAIFVSIGFSLYNAYKTQKIIDRIEHRLMDLGRK